MRRFSRTSQVKSPHRLDTLNGIVARLCPDLSGDSRNRVAEMAEFMREVATNDEGCTRTQLLAAGFHPAEIDGAGRIAQEALKLYDATPVPVDAIEPFSAADASALRRTRARLLASDPLALVA